MNRWIAPVVIVVMASTVGVSQFASASQLALTPKNLKVFQLTTKPNVAKVLKVVASEDTWNDDNNQNLTHGTDVKLGLSGPSNYNVDLGTCCTGVKNGQAYVKFDLSSLPAGATIRSATLQLSGGPTTIGGSPATVRRVTSAWSGATMTTSNRPDSAGGGSAVTGSATNVSGTMVMTFNVASDVTGRATNLLNGWELRAGGNTGSWWYSSEWATAAQQPTLTVVYQ